jgi:hypothetical protein
MTSEQEKERKGLKSKQKITLESAKCTIGSPKRRIKVT